MSNHEIIGKGLLAVLAGASGNTPEEEATSILDEEEKLIAEKAAKLIARDYGETIKELGEE